MARPTSTHSTAGPNSLALFIRINPPLVISAEQTQEGIAILDEVFAYVQRHIDYKRG